MEKTNLTQILSSESIPKETQFQIRNPIGVTDTQMMQPAARLKDLHGKRIGLFWNSKARGDVALKTVQALLAERFSDLEFNWFTTDASTALAQKELQAVSEQQNDAIISTTGD